MMERVPVCLSIAGSDSGGGAGIQADLKAFARCGVHGTTAITALTAQNTVGVELVAAVAPEMIVAQVRAVASDLGVDAVKVGMLGDEATIDAVLEALELVGDAPVVVDPVMIASSGAALLDPTAKAALIERVLPRARVITPNVPEARALSGLGEGASARELGEALLAHGPGAVIVTGGHAEDGADLLVEPDGAISIDGPRYADGASHGSGCTHSSALAAFLARGEELADAARWAREVASEAVGNGLRDLGAGVGPVDVFGMARGGSGRLVAPRHNQRHATRADEGRARRPPARRGRSRAGRRRGATGRRVSPPARPGPGRGGADADGRAPRGDDRPRLRRGPARRRARDLLPAGRRRMSAAERDAQPEAKARELMRAVLCDDDFRTYEELGFISVPGRGDPAAATPTSSTRTARSSPTTPRPGGC